MNSGYDGVYKEKRDSGVAQYFSTPALLTGNLEENEGEMCAGQNLAAFDVWFGWIVFLSLEKSGQCAFPKLVAVFFEPGRMFLKRMEITSAMFAEESTRIIYDCYWI